MSRTRSREHKSTIVGSAHSNTYLGGASSNIKTLDLLKSEVCKDRTSPWPYIQNNPLFLVKRVDGAVTLSGTITIELFVDPWIRDKYENWPIELLKPSFGVESLTPLSSYAGIALERAAPDKPSLNLGEFAAGLRELPKTIRYLRQSLLDFALNAPKSIASLHLLDEFAVKPLLSDVQALLDLQNSLSSSMQKHRKAERGESFAGTIHNFEREDERRAFFASSFFLHSYDVLWKYRNKVWYSLNFDKDSLPSSSDLNRKLPGKILDLDVPLLTLWELIPWSFLIDYFIDLGTFIGNYNSLNVGHICIMREQFASEKVSNQDSKPSGLWSERSNSLVFRSRRGTLSLKERHVFSTGKFVPIKLFLSLKQLSNILALGITNVRG